MTTAPAPAPAPAAAPAQRRRRLPMVTEEDKVAARTAEALIRALAILGFVSADGQTFICPLCTKQLTANEFKRHDDGGFKHFNGEACGTGPGGGITALTDGPLKLDFPDAVRALVGKPTSIDIPIPESIPEIATRAFKAVSDPEVLHGVLAYGRKAFGGEGVRAAQAHYGQWHIDPDVVAESGAVYITNPDHFATEIVRKFRLDRLIACGLFVLNKDDKPMCLISKKWPVVEPGRDAAGTVTNLQFRASNAQYERYKLHKAKKLPYEGNQKFVNLRGVPNENYLGCGLDAIAKLTTPTDVFWVEGFKDRLAGLSLGVPAVYGIPGVSYRPPTAVLEVMKPHRAVLSLDGDDAGAGGMYGLWREDENGTKTLVKPGLVDYLRGHDIAVAVNPLRDGLDITDSLVLRHVEAGCACTACTTLRARLTT